MNIEVEAEGWLDNDVILVSRERVADFKEWMDR